MSHNTNPRDERTCLYRAFLNPLYDANTDAVVVTASHGNLYLHITQADEHVCFGGHIGDEVYHEMTTHKLSLLQEAIGKALEYLGAYQPEPYPTVDTEDYGLAS